MRGLIRPRHRLGTILLAKRERILICHPEESFEAEQVICEMQASPGTMLGKRKVYEYRFRCRDLNSTCMLGEAF